MIKIEIPNISAKKQEYIEAVKPYVKERIELLLISSKHLSGDTIDLSVLGFVKYSQLTSKILIKFVSPDDRKGFKFTKDKYVKTIAICLSSQIIKSTISKFELNKIINFLEKVLSNNCKLLDEILVCEPYDLFSFSTKILKEYKINGVYSKYILSLAFDYSNIDVSDSIKFFFRKNNFVNFCPYCNINEILYIETQGGKAAAGHQLDHFFDKASYPLLACSFFNLVPSDSICNGSTNKGSIPFTDEFHLNPYIVGFNNNLVFEPILLGNSVKEVMLKINAKKGSSIRKKMLGSSEEINEDNIGNNYHREGNVNVFLLRSKYRNRKKNAENVLKDIYRANNGIVAIQKFLDLMTDLNKKEIYIEWYESTIKTPFYEEKFNDNGFSKFNKDIHDFYYRMDEKSRSEYMNPT